MYIVSIYSGKTVKFEQPEMRNNTNKHLVKVNNNTIIVITEYFEELTSNNVKVFQTTCIKISHAHDVNKNTHELFLGHKK